MRALLEAVERLRRERFEQLDPALVREILQMHFEGKTADAEILRRLEQAVERHLSQGD
jgi:hypothetical protein